MNRRRVTNIVLPLLVLALAGGGVYAFIRYKKKPEQKEPDKPARRVRAPAVRAVRNYPVRLVAYGSARPKTQVEIAPQVGGKVKYVAESFRSGLAVHKGQLLIRIEKTDYLQAKAAAEARIANLEAQLAQLDAQIAQLEQEKRNLEALEELETDRLELARQDLERTRTLYEREIASSTELDQARQAVLAQRTQLRNIENQLSMIEPRRKVLRANVESTRASKRSAQVELSQAETQLARCEVVSPVTGRTLSRNVEEERPVAANAVCGVVYATDTMEVPISIDARDLRWLDPEHLGACERGRELPRGRIPASVRWTGDWRREPAAIEADESPERPETRPATRPDGTPAMPDRIMWPGCVNRIEAGLDPETRTVTLVVQVGNPSLDRPDATQRADAGAINMLDPQMYCKVTVSGRVLDEAFLLPREALRQDGTVFVAENGRLVAREVEVARKMGERMLILPNAGIAEGDRVVVTPLPAVAPGTEVEVMPEPGEAAPATRPSGREP